MKKKTALIILLVITLIALTACGSSGSGSGGSSSSGTQPTKTEETTPQPQYPTAKLGDTVYEFNETNKHYGMSFKYSHDWQISGFNETMNLFHGSESNPDFVVSLVFYDGQSVQQGIAALSGGAEISTKEFNGITWSHFTIQAEQKTNSLYLADVSSGCYIVLFQSDKDMTELEQVFMENAAF